MAATASAEFSAWLVSGHQGRNCQARPHLQQSQSGASRCTNRQRWPLHALALTITSTSGVVAYEIRQGAEDIGHIAAQGYVHLRAVRPGPLHAKVCAGAAGQDAPQGADLQIRVAKAARRHCGSV